ncbi:unnamed protein product [Clonostachys byssicola]|uniref:N-acetyltransferase domain-containing protein n=1 Tax=Clonostachys byssicola TaxID=160290 RepID=A0A9N9TXW1_9HYPO|nr:unnamed protein product [Clonostachys byssicola]
MSSDDKPQLLRPCLEWQRDGYIISTDSSLISTASLNGIFADKGCYWANPLPETTLRRMLDNSLTFGLFESKAIKADMSGVGDTKDCLILVGLARCVTDMVTFMYVDDVWVSPEQRGNGLGKWLLECVRETMDQMPHLRRSMLHTQDWKRSVPFYEELLGMEVVNEGQSASLAVMERKGPGAYC